MKAPMPNSSRTYTAVMNVERTSGGACEIGVAGA